MAFPDLGGIGFGFKTRAPEAPRSRPRGAVALGQDAARAESVKVLIRIPCVVFEVRRKHKLTHARDRGRMLPTHLFTYVGELGARELCAVPTDVKPSMDFGRPVPHNKGDSTGLPFGIVVRPRNGNSNANGAGGAIACAVSGAGNAVMAVGCRHVLSRSLQENPDVRSGCIIETGDGAGPIMGSSDSTRGQYVEAPLPSFDAQLLSVDSRAALRLAMSGIRFSTSEPLLLDPADIPNGFWVATPRADSGGERLKIWVTYIDCPVYRPMPYRMPGGTIQIAHAMTIHAEAREEQLMPGDSGSPALLVKGGSKLIGMYLGGDGFHCYFIPAWQLMNPANYGTTGKDWAIANP